MSTFLFSSIVVGYIWHSMWNLKFEMYHLKGVIKQYYYFNFRYKSGGISQNKKLVVQYDSLQHKQSDPKLTEVNKKLLMNSLDFRSSHEAALPAEHYSKERQYSKEAIIHNIFFLLKEEEIKTGTLSRLKKQFKMRTKNRIQSLLVQW